MSQIKTDKYEQPEHLLQKRQADELRTVEFFQLSASHLMFELHVLIMKRKRTDTTQTQHRHRVSVHVQSSAAADEELQ